VCDPLSRRQGEEIKVIRPPKAARRTTIVAVVPSAGALAEAIAGTALVSFDPRLEVRSCRTLCRAGRSGRNRLLPDVVCFRSGAESTSRVIDKQWSRRC